MPWMKIAIDECCHVSWKVRSRSEDKYRHAIGTVRDKADVTDELAQMCFGKSGFVTPWIPVLFTSRALLTDHRSRNCVTDALRAVVRGWFYFG